MKIFISADIEGTAGINHWEETIHGNADWTEYRALMTAELLAACEGARAAGATEVVVKDAHDSGRNLLVDRLPDYVRIVRNWSGHPDGMMFGLDASFAAAIYTGYHAKAGTEDNPLAHTMNLKISRMLLNGEVASELTVNALCAALYDVPSVFLSGDAGICADARSMIPGIGTVETLFGAGPASNSIAPARSCRLIREGVEAVLAARAGGMPATDGPWELVLEFVNPVNAYQSGWYPGARAHGPRAVAFASDDFFEILRALRFMKS
ncbi:M55 family metallopeptidase [Mesorhizobium sp. CAU 1741]|uniref:M55 family metallopeptidase n=1 Tax=Mesorhizobium sp. CAU 1741 TaxID=3140366 RepID=UPI00325BD319